MNSKSILKIRNEVAVNVNGVGALLFPWEVAQNSGWCYRHNMAGCIQDATELHKHKGTHGILHRVVQVSPTWYNTCTEQMVHGKAAQKPAKCTCCMAPLVMRGTTQRWLDNCTRLTMNEKWGTSLMAKWFSSFCSFWLLLGSHCTASWGRGFTQWWGPNLQDVYSLYRKFHGAFIFWFKYVRLFGGYLFSFAVNLFCILWSCHVFGIHKRTKLCQQQELTFEPVRRVITLPEKDVIKVVTRACMWCCEIVRLRNSVVWLLDVASHPDCRRHNRR